MSAKQLADQCEMSQPTVYRRVEWLQEYGLIEEQTQIETGGNDYSVFAATLSEFSLALADGDFETEIERTEPPAFPGQGEQDTADRFTKMWENL